MRPEVIKRLPYGLLVSVGGAAPTLWLLAKIRTSKWQRRCYLCQKEITPGSTAWRTVENTVYRATRVCNNCWSIDGCEEESDSEGQREGDQK